MIDIIVRYELEGIVKETIVTLDEWLEDVEVLEDVVTELVKEKIGEDRIELVEWETVRDRNFDIYKITY